MRVRVGQLATLLLASVLTRPAAAEGPELEAQRAMERGVNALDRGQTEQALAQFHRAQELVPEANLPYRYAGRALEALGRWADAIDAYQRYLEIKPNVRDAAAVRARIDDLRARHLEGSLDVTCKPDGAEVRVDDEPGPAGVTPLRGLRLPAGEHTLRLRAPGHEPRDVPASVAPGSFVVVHCELRETPPAPPPNVPPAAVVARTAEPPATRLSPRPPDFPPTRWYRRWWVWTGVGALVVGATLGTVLVLRPDLPASDGGAHPFP